MVLIFIPASCLAAIVSSQNFFSDTIAGFTVALLCGSILLWITPSDHIAL